MNNKRYKNFNKKKNTEMLVTYNKLIQLHLEVYAENCAMNLCICIYIWNPKHVKNKKENKILAIQKS